MTNSQFTQLYISNEDALYNFAKRLARNTYEAADLVQETAIKTFNARNSFKRNTSFKSWAFTILKNTFISQYRKSKKMGVLSPPIEDLNHLIKDNYTHRNKAISKLTVEEIKSNFEVLSNKTSVPFSMYTEGYKYEEISEMLNIPIGTVKSRINYARQKLKDVVTR